MFVAARSVKLWGAAGVLRALIVDDEPIACETLRLLLEERCGDLLCVIGSAHSAAEARRLLPQLQPDIVFLDVEMPGEDGFTLLRSLPQRDFAVIFVTAYEHYAVQALRVSAVDYLLKPVNPEELRQAVERAWQQRLWNAERFATLLANLGQPKLQRLVLPVVGGYHVVHVDEVLYCQSRGSYSYVVTNKERFLAVRLLAEWEELLASAGFVRIHRAFLVNVRHIRSLRRVEPDGSGVLVLQTGEELPVSRRRFATVVATLQRGV